MIERGQLGRTAVSIAFIAAAAITPAAAKQGDVAPSRCRIHQLAQPGWGDSSGVVAGDPTGRWLAGYASDDEIDSRAVVWHRGRPEILDVPLESARLGGINRNGVTMGSGDPEPSEGTSTGSSAAGLPVAFGYVDGNYLPLATPAGTDYAVATGISNDGTISGSAYVVSTGREFAVSWSLEHPTEPVRLPVPPGISSARAVGISPDGWIGVSAVTTGPAKAISCATTSPPVGPRPY